jgi:cytochrome c oxidase subunit 1
MLFAMIGTLWGGSIRFTTPMLFALSFIAEFLIGGVTGIWLGSSGTDIYLHDTYFVLAHFHYTFVPIAIIGTFAAIYYWFPKMFGRKLNEFWGKIHFALSFVFMNLVFAPMFVQGLEGMHRRMYDGGATYAAAEGIHGLSAFALKLNVSISHAAWLLGWAQVPFIVNLFWSIWKGRKVEADNPWEATTLEWATPTPPPHGNFASPPVAYRGPYEYSQTKTPNGFTPQNEPA